MTYGIGKRLARHSVTVSLVIEETALPSYPFKYPTILSDPPIAAAMSENLNNKAHFCDMKSPRPLPSAPMVPGLPALERVKELAQ